MTTKLPQVPGPRLIRALKRAGFIEHHQVGSHLTMRHEIDVSRRVTFAVHGSRPVSPGVLRDVLKGAGLTADELRDLL
ncbi:MAG: type II toxin-antitoxin system HicA family toxin [Myxococcales bacterium]